MKQADKDYRYMAISDLYNELQKDTFKMDADSEKKIVRKLLEMVALDKAAEVRAFAVKWYVESSERAAMYSSLFLGCTKKKKVAHVPFFFPAFLLSSRKSMRNKPSKCLINLPPTFTKRRTSKSAMLLVLVCEP
jgi:hypothetical protein